MSRSRHLLVFGACTRSLSGLEVLDNSMARDLAAPRSRWKVGNPENVQICNVFGMFMYILHGTLGLLRL